MLERRTPLVFVVDDEEIIASTIALVLNTSGFRAVAYTSAVEAMQAAESGSPSLLLTDVNMPEMSGIDLAIQFRAAHPHCKTLLLSGHLATGDLLEMARTKGHDFQILAKPLHPDELLASIREAIV